MIQKRNNVLSILSAMITTLLLYLLLRLGTSDFGLSVVPGWHTTVYPAEITRAIITIAIVAAAVLVYSIFKGTLKLMSFLLRTLNF